MKTNILLSLLLSVVLIGFGTAQDHTNHKPSDDQTKKGSPRTAAMAMIGDNHIHIDYSSPSVRGRVIWGGLVAYDKVWVTGAHKATTISFNKDVAIAGKTIEKGKYAFFTIPGKDEWTVIINKNWDQHLADKYDTQLDVVRFTVTPEILDELQESLKYDVQKKEDNTAVVTMSWERIRISFEAKNL